MATRPIQHILEDLAHAALRQEFAKAGWTTEQLSEDYGEDFLVRIFCEGQATPFSIYIQSKSTQAIERYMSKDSTTISYPINTNQLVHWERFWEPVVLTVYDKNTSNTYWRVIQPWLENLPKIKRKKLSKNKKSCVSIPTKNLLDENGIERLLIYTKNRFNRFYREQQGANYLIKCLKEAIGLEISYDAQNGILVIPVGHFQEDNGDAQCYFFGKTGAKLSEIAKKNKKTEEQALIDAIEYTSSMSKHDIDKVKRKTNFIDDA